MHTFGLPWWPNAVGMLLVLWSVASCGAGIVLTAILGVLVVADGTVDTGLRRAGEYAGRHSGSTDVSSPGWKKMCIVF